KKIEFAVAIVVQPGTGGGEGTVVDSGSLRDINKSPAAASVGNVVKEAAPAHAREENIVTTVVIVIAHGHAHAIEREVQTRLDGDVGKRPIMVVAVEADRGAGAV